MAKRMGDGCTYREHLLRVVNQGGPMPALLQEAGRPIPAEVRPIWDVWHDLAMIRAPGMAGPAPITYADLHGWSQAHGVRLTSWEQSTVLAMDAAALAVVAEQRDKS